MSNAYTLAGLAIAELVDNALQALGVREDKDEFLHSYTDKGRKIFERWCIAAAFESLGLELDENEPINAQSLTAAINALLNGEIEFTNVFDSAAIKRDVMREALDRINEQSGLGLQSLSAGALKQAAKRLLAERLREQIASGAGSMLDAMPDVQSIIDDVESVQNGGIVPSTAPYAEQNRDRQAAYRASHSRSWRAK